MWTQFLHRLYLSVRVHLGTTQAFGHVRGALKRVNLPLVMHITRKWRNRNGGARAAHQPTKPSEIAEVLLVPFS